MRINLRSIGFHFFIIGLATLYPCANEGRGEAVTLGEYLKFPSQVFREDVTYFVHLPSGYERDTKEYPILYFLNAQIISTTANAVATVENLGFELIPEMILIGLCNTGKTGEYFPLRPDGKPGNADLFLEFLVEEFVPFIDGAYRSSGFRVLMGQSNTGFFTLYALLENPIAFQAYIAASPTLGWGLEFIKSKARDAFISKSLFEVFLYMNYGEKDYGDLVIDPIQDFEDFLEKQAPAGLNWHLEYLNNDGHVPVPSLNNALLSLFPDYFLTDVQRSKGLDWVDAHYQTLSKKYGFRISAPEEVLFNMSYVRKQKKDPETAIALFEVLLKRYPASVRGHYFLGETYRETGKLLKAIECYTKALTLDPDFEAAKKRLEELKTAGVLLPDRTVVVQGDRIVRISLGKILSRPFMFINSFRYSGYEQIFLKGLGGEGYVLTLPKADHYNFHDVSLLDPNHPMLGEIDGKRMIEIMNEFILAFFDRYLKKVHSGSFDSLEDKYSEVNVYLKMPEQ